MWLWVVLAVGYSVEGEEMMTEKRVMKRERPHVAWAVFASEVVRGRDMWNER